MSLGAKIRSVHGRSGTITAVASAAAVTVSEESDVFVISGSDTITSLLGAGGVLPGRIVTFIGAASAAVVFTNTNDPTTSGQMDLGGSNVTLGAQDVLTLVRLDNGTWLRVSASDN